MAENPLTNDEPPAECREDAYFDFKQENALYDAYLMLRDAGYTQDELAPLAALIEQATIYNRNTAEKMHQSDYGG